MDNATRKKGIAKQAERIYKDTNFSKGECEALLKTHSELIKGNGKLDRSTFRDVLHNTFSMTDDILMDRVFRVFDRDMDGWINREEWVKGLSVFLRGSLEEKTDFSFKVYDLNSDGVISREEMFQLLKATLTKQTNEEDPDEGVRDLVEVTYKKYDVDHDGKVTFQNFKEAVTDEPLLLEGLGCCLPEEKVARAFLCTFEEVSVPNSISYISSGTKATTVS